LLKFFIFKYIPILFSIQRVHYSLAIQDKSHDFFQKIREKLQY